MCKRIIAWVVFAAQGVLLWMGVPVTPRGQRLDMDQFTLTWREEFDGDSLDRAKWGGHCFGTGPWKRRDGWWYIEMPEVYDGMLRIPTVYSGEGIAGGPPDSYYSCGIDTRGRFEQKFGYFEARCMFPKGEGLWSAFWLFNDLVGRVDGTGRDGTEVDIYESPYYIRKCRLMRDMVGTNLHFDGYGEHQQSQRLGRFRVKAPYDTFHTYGVEWNETEYIFYIDGRETRRTSFGGVCQEPLWLILSVEQEYGGWAGDIRNNRPDEMTDFVVDYVRVYQYKELVEVE